MEAVDRALEKLGLDGGRKLKEDARFESLTKLIDERLRAVKKWKDDERLIIFTEYKTTLDDLVHRLRERYEDQGTAIRDLYGGMDLAQRELIKNAFNDPDDPVRILVATDAASEGLNLQDTARLLVHFDIPWNPSRLEQRNGRLDRHGQARDVIVHHFVSEEQADLRFLAHVVEKGHTIREDLGSLGEVFDAAFERRFELGHETDAIAGDLDRDVEARRGLVQLPASGGVSAEEARRLSELAKELDLDAATLRSTLELALGVGAGLPRIDGPDSKGRLRLLPGYPPRWQPVVDDSLLLPTAEGGRGRLAAIAFDPASFIEERQGLRVFRPRRDTALLHLGHPLFREALSLFARQRFPGGHQAPVSRWIARRGPVPKSVDALLLLTVEELATNELREPFHQWVRTLRFPVAKRQLGELLPHVPPGEEIGIEALPAAELESARAVWEDVELELKARLRDYAKSLSNSVRELLEAEGKRAKTAQARAYDKRIDEVRAYVSAQSLEKLEKERAKLVKALQQGTLGFVEHRRRELETRLDTVAQELARRKRNAEDQVRLLLAERARVLDQLLPRRHALGGEVQVYPVSIELRLPEGAR
jgi:hypothetical protein